MNGAILPSTCASQFGSFALGVCGGVTFEKKTATWILGHFGTRRDIVCSRSPTEESHFVRKRERERERDYESLKWLNGKLVLTVALLVAVYFKYII